MLGIGAWHSLGVVVDTPELVMDLFGSVESVVAELDKESLVVFCYGAVPALGVGVVVPELNHGLVVVPVLSL